MNVEHISPGVYLDRKSRVLICDRLFSTGRVLCRSAHQEEARNVSLAKFAEMAWFRLPNHAAVHLRAALAQFRF